MPRKVGELAKLTGVSVRTLHHYEAIGLLKPAMRNEGGHRCYTEAEVERLQRILSLRELGFSLEDIGRCLDAPGYALGSVVELHLARLAEQITRQQVLHQRLERLHERLQRGETVPVTHLLETMEAITMIEKYLTPEQQQVLQARRDASENPIEEFKANVAELRALKAAGKLPTDPEVQAVARRHRGTHTHVAGEDKALAEGLRRMLSNEPE
ncbi:MAG TPA: MerR family transcriptional regulator, partial [Oscillatoriaceae cyanobacterium]